jgi:hypothetical protein
MHGTPAPVLEYWIMPLVRTPAVRGVVRFVTNPAAAWLAATVMLWLWHVPRLYELALESDSWHRVEHGCLLATALLFWWPVVQPNPSRAVWPRVAMLPYLFLAAVQATVLCAFLTFADHVLYPHYEIVPRIWGLSALSDQAIAGAMMWIAGLMAYLIPSVYLGHRLLYRLLDGNRVEGTFALRPVNPRRAAQRWIGRPLAIVEPAWAVSPQMQSATWTTATRSRAAATLLEEVDVSAEQPRARGPETPSAARQSASSGSTAIAAHPTAAFDLLRAPGLGRLLRWPYTRHAMQVALMAIAALIVVDGLTGTQVAPLNLAGVLPWIHWRGLVVLMLLVGGNFFCMACPFTLPRAIARRWLAPAWDWPRGLRSKWLAIGLLLAFFWAYEALDLWASPWWTAWIVIGYFVVAFSIDMLFRGASFCKYVCPIGQFQFVQSLVSPWEVRVRDASQCATCSTKECIRGGPAARGCEMQLFAPRKSGNLDCTFCLDCVHACPVANIGVLATVPGAEFVREPTRGAFDRLTHRPDVAALVLLLVFAAFANAAGMIAPVVVGQDRAAEALGLSRFAVESCYLLATLVVLPITAIALAGACARRWSGDTASTASVIARFAGTLAPLGAAMWLAHYGFHFATGATTCVAAAARFASDWGWPIAGADSFVRRCCAVEPPAWLVRSEIFCLDLGLLASLYFAYRVAVDSFEISRRGFAAFLPWGTLAAALFLLGVWILLEPMEMRGTFPPGGGPLGGGG